MDNIAEGFCRFLQGQGDNAECTCTRLEPVSKNRRRELRSDLEWMVTIEVASESRDARSSSMAITTNETMRDEVANMIYDEIASDSETASAISDQQSFEVSSSAASPTSSAEDEDDEGMFSGTMLYAAAGGAVALVLAFVAMMYCYCRHRAIHAGSRDVILGATDGLNNTTFVTQDNTLMASAHSQEDVLSAGSGDDVFVAERTKEEPSDSVFKL